MNEIRCLVKGCSEVFKTEEPVSSNARFICKNHPKETQVRADGRVFDKRTDRADEKVHFQTVQFDPKLSGGI